MIPLQKDTAAGADDEAENTLIFDDLSESDRASSHAKSTKVRVPTELSKKVAQLTEEFTHLILQQHQALLKVLLSSPCASAYVEAQFTSNVEPEQNKTYKSWLLRPVCGCYTCNLCACSETFPFVEEIFPCIKLKRTIVQDGTVQYAVNPKEFVEKVFGTEYTSELGRACPYWRSFVAQCCD